MHQLSPAFKRPTSWTTAVTVRSKNDPQRKVADDSVVSTCRPSILVVDDDQSAARMLRDALDVWGYDVILACNGLEGLYLLDGQVVEGILLDIQMPVMDGPTMLDELRWLGYQTPVVVMSGDLNGSTLRQLAQEGAQGFMIKPFSLPALHKLCVTIFENHGADFSPDHHSYLV